MSHPAEPKAFQGIACERCGGKFPDLPEYKDHLGDCNTQLAVALMRGALALGWLEP